MVLFVAALALACTPVLEISVEHGAPVRLPLVSAARFSVRYWHSMYDVPVVETFVVDGAHIRLTHVRSPSAAALEYLGIDGPVDTDIPLARAFDTIAFRVATKQAQVLTIGEHERSFRDFGEAGARVVFTPT